MGTKETNYIELLQNARQQIQAPFSQMRQHLLIIHNGVFVLGASAYLLSEKATTGHFFPHPVLGYLYEIVGLINLVSLFYSVYWRENALYRRWLKWPLRGQSNKKVKRFLRWSSVLTVMVLSACFMLGIGNPSSDSLVGDFALGHLLIVLSAMILGRRVAISWFAIVMGILIYVSFIERGYDYQYNYLTPAESASYHAELVRGGPVALKRQAILRANHLNPPTVSRYFNMWTIYIVVAGLTSWFFAGLAVKMFRVIPLVERDIKTYIDVASQEEMGRLQEKNLLNEERLLLRQEALNAELKNLKAQINPHFLFNTLNYLYMKSLEYPGNLADSILKLSDIMEYSVRDAQQWVGLDEEIDHMHQFIELVQLRNDHKLFVDFRVTGPVKQIKILPFILIGLLENAFKHGNMLDPNSPLTIKIKAQPPHLNVYICNRKNLKKRVSSTMIGLNNTRRRLELTYRNPTFIIEQDENSFCITLSIDTYDLREALDYVI